MRRVGRMDVLWGCLFVGIAVAAVLNDPKNPPDLPWLEDMIELVAMSFLR